MSAGACGDDAFDLLRAGRAARPPAPVAVAHRTLRYDPARNGVRRK